MNIVNVRGRGGRGRRVIQRKKPKYQTQSAHSQRENTRLHRQRRKKRGRQYTKDHEVAHLEATPRTQCTLDRAKNTVDLLSAITPQSGQILMGVLRTLLSNTLTIGVEDTSFASFAIYCDDRTAHHKNPRARSPSNNPACLICLQAFVTSIHRRLLLCGI